MLTCGNSDVDMQQRQASFTELVQCSKGVQELVLLVGMQGSGKSTLRKQVFVPAGYAYANRDELGKMEKCIAVVKAALSSGKSVVVDNTNPDAKSRSQFIEQAKALGVRVRCIHLTATLEQCVHMNLMRDALFEGRELRVPKQGYKDYAAKFKKPDQAEGIDIVKEFPFTPTFTDEKHLAFFKRWYWW